MKVVAATPLYPPGSLVGAWLTTHEFLRHLASRGHDVSVIQCLSRTASYEHEGVTVHGRQPDTDQLLAGADVIVSHLGDNGHAAKIARRTGTPSVRMIHSHHTDAAQRLMGTTLAVFNSEHLLERSKWGGPSLVLPPPVLGDRYRTEPGDAVTLVNLSEPKGGRLFWRLTRLMPDVAFLGVRAGIGAQIAGHGNNVSTLDATLDMRDVYAQTRIVLMPSNRESWGRVGVEAMASGIPTIAHPTIGLRESLGDAGMFVNRHDTGGWVAAIRRLLDPAEWAVASKAARARFAQLDPIGDLDRFADAVEALA